MPLGTCWWDPVGQISGAREPSEGEIVMGKGSSPGDLGFIYIFPFPRKQNQNKEETKS